MSSFQHQILLHTNQNHHLVMKHFHGHRIPYPEKENTYQDQDL